MIRKLTQFSCFALLAVVAAPLSASAATQQEADDAEQEYRSARTAAGWAIFEANETLEYAQDLLDFFGPILDPGTAALVQAAIDDAATMITEAENEYSAGEMDAHSARTEYLAMNYSGAVTLYNAAKAHMETAQERAEAAKEQLEIAIWLILGGSGGPNG